MDGDNAQASAESGPGKAQPETAAETAPETAAEPAAEAGAETHPAATAESGEPPGAGAAAEPANAAPAHPEAENEPQPPQAASEVAPDRASAPDPASAPNPAKPPNPPSLPGNLTLSQLQLQLPLAASESITCVAAHGANLYLGTSAGQVLHMYLFDDAAEYIAILQLAVGAHAVAKLLLLPDADTCLVLCNGVVSAYSLPELSPLRTGKIKAVHDMSPLSAGAAKSRRDKVLLFSQAKIRVVQYAGDSAKLLKDISYTDAVLGVSSAGGKSAHYSNICLVANADRYDVVDMQQPRKIPLFDYNPAAEPAIRPALVPFWAQDPDTPHEEYMLPVCSDSRNSMAMFVDAAGAVTRGTLAWMGVGYPRAGLAVEWPYAVGLFDNNSLVFSSLESLAVEVCVPCASFSEDPDLTLQGIETGVKVVDKSLSDLLRPVSPFSKAAPAQARNSFSRSRVVVFSKKALFTLNKPSEMAGEIHAALANVHAGEDLSSSISYFQSQPSDQFCHSMYILLLVISDPDEARLVISKQHKTLRTDPRLLLLMWGFSADENDPFWQDFTVEACLLQVLKSKNMDEESVCWLIREIHANSGYYSDLIAMQFRKWMYTRVCKTSSDLLEIVNSEAEIWQGQSSANAAIMDFLHSHDHALVELRIFLLKQEIGNAFEDWALKILNLCLGMLADLKSKTTADTAKSREHVIAVGNEKFDLLAIAFKQLVENVHDEETYTKKLLQIMQACPEEGAQFLKSNRNGKFKNTHTHLLRELTKSSEYQATFSSLKIEYLEQTLADKIESGQPVESISRELLEEHLHLISADDQVGRENLNILFTTFKVENDLGDPHWPKFSWVDFLQLNHNKTECAEYLRSYMKVYELLVFLAKSTGDIKIEGPLDNEAFAYLEKMPKPDTEFLLSIGDYSTAEWVAVHGTFPMPSRPIFKHKVESKPLAAETVAERVQNLLVYYLQNGDSTARNFVTMHLLTAQSRYFEDPLDTLEQLPQDTPLLYVQEYLVGKLADLEEKKLEAIMHKGLAKGEARLHANAVARMERG